MQIKPVLAALRRHKAGALLIALQIALTLAIVCNALFIIHERVTRVARASGVEETQLFAIHNEWAQGGDSAQTDAQMRADLTALRSLGSVQEAYSSNSFPLRGGGWDNFIRLSPTQLKGTVDSAIFFADEHTLATLGSRLIAGRNFDPSDVGSQTGNDPLHSQAVIISRTLAEKLFPNGTALNKTIYVSGDHRPSIVIGVTDTLQSHMIGNWAKDQDYNVVFIPARLTDDETFYLVRARAGQLDQAMREVPKALFAQSRMRIINSEDGVMSFAQVRQRAYESDYGMAILMGIICAVLLAITAAGIVGLTSFWVGQRRKQIGVRRALGARKRDILSYFLTENLLISGGGIAVGIVVAVAMNLWMVTQFEMERLSLAYVAGGVALLLVLGQAAVFAPAMRASRVSPVEATRSV